MPGGVCAILDYEVSLMAEYVAEMATRVVLPNQKVNGAFRKFVTQILTSTRLPRTTILLALNYLAKRVNLCNSAGPAKTFTEGEVWRLLTVSLLLGSKFLDDNTFQNKSWSEVSGITVQELNTLEIGWVLDMNWGLYVNLDESKDYNAWLENWKEWLRNKQLEAQAQVMHERLAALVPPTDSDIPRLRRKSYDAWHQMQIAEYERLSSMKRNPPPSVGSVSSYRPDMASWNYNGKWHTSPLTPPDSGYGTPEYVNSAASVNNNYAECFDRALVTNFTGRRSYQAPVNYSGYHGSNSYRGQGNYSSTYVHKIWEPQISVDCNCVSCHNVHKHQSYFMSHGYRNGQPIAG